MIFFIYYFVLIVKINSFININIKNKNVFTKIRMDYPLSRNYYEQSLRRLNSKNNTIHDFELLKNNITKNFVEKLNESFIIIHHVEELSTNDTINKYNEDDINTRNNALKKMMENYYNKNNENIKNKKSENFEIITNTNNKINFSNIGGFDNIKSEMLQCIDMLKNWKKYIRFSVRTPKGIILEGPPGNGKTLLARGFAGEANISFIPVSGSEFQNKYIGVGSSKVRELFKLASDNKPCIIFIDEIDALGRKRNDGDNAERDNTLNQLLVEMDGFNNNTGIFIIGATNRVDLLDTALMRPGRIDKTIYVGMPDLIARNFIIDIHIKGKPNNLTKENFQELVKMTNGFSGSQIENLLNEAMLFALKNNKEVFNMYDIDTIYNRILGGMQNEEHIISDEMLQRICVHELGHSLVSFHCKHHPLMKKIVINLTSPHSPGMTIFENDNGIENLTTYEQLFERITILYGGRIAELLIYGENMISSGASNDFDIARQIAQKMVINYGMGKNKYGGIGENSKEKINIEIEQILSDAYEYAYSILQNNKDSIISGSIILKKEKILTRKDLLTYLML